jgi:hypothetical protein
MKKENNKCYCCQSPIDIKQDLYYLFIHIRRFTDNRSPTEYLKMCDKCFYLNADDTLITRLNDLSSGNITGTNDNWRTCPYCKVTLQYANLKSNFQLAEILGSSLNTLALHSKCYNRNIGIPENEYSI